MFKLSCSLLCSISLVVKRLGLFHQACQDEFFTSLNN